MTVTAAALDFGPATHLTCRACGEQYPLGAAYACMECFGPLEVGYSLGTPTRESIAAGPPTMWRYRSLLPVPAQITEQPGLHPGFTKLVRADNLARELRMRRLWVKDDTGNLANAVAAAAARAGMKHVVVIPSNLEAGKVITTAVYDGALIAVEGTYDDVNRLCSELIGDPLTESWGFVNVNLRPYYAEGSKSLGYEVAEQLGWRLPEQVVIPIASGSLLTKIDKAFRELGTLGLVEPSPYRVFGAQATGCSPVSQAFRAGFDVVRPVKPDTIAKSLAIGNPADGPYALDVARRTNGAIADVSDEDVVKGIRLLARTEGIFAETAGGVTVATLKQLLETGQLDPDAETVVYNTGDGLKTLDAVAPVVGPTATIAPSIDQFRAALGG